MIADLPSRPPLRRAITAARRRPEPECIAALLPLAEAPAGADASVDALARRLAEGLRGRAFGLGRDSMVQGLLQEFSLSSEEGVALMCLAEALLRIPDDATRDALIRDKVGKGDWRSHAGRSASPFVNAAAWGLVVTGRLVATHDEARLSGALARVTSRCGEPIVRKAVDLGMRLMGRQFVAGEDIGEALRNARRQEAQGFRYSYDMLGEAALTAADATRYCAAYEAAILAIGAAGAGRGIHDGPGISIKLSALHPRYSVAQRERVMAELLPRLASLAVQAREHDIGINIDAEEADRLELSLDLLEALCEDPRLAGWAGIGFVVQAYSKRCPFVIDHLVDLARRTGHRLMVRLVKGAYWDSEIKRAQVEGLDGYPVFTRKPHTDVSYLACARKLLDATDAVYPQFATHNAQTLASIYHMAGSWRPGQYEFQCLHGMGEPLYLQVVGDASKGGLARPCRIYAPVGTHETLLAYLVRRLLENGANTSFINRIADPEVSLDDLVESPVAATRRIGEAAGVLGAPHPAIPLPREIFGEVRPNSLGIDLTDEAELARIAAAAAGSRALDRVAEPTLRISAAREAAPVRNPADLDDVVGRVVEAGSEEVEAALVAAAAAEPRWAGIGAPARATMLARAADLMEAQMPVLLDLIVREAGKTWANAVAEVREAVDFLRYYAREARTQAGDAVPLGTVACISPWNFPLAIFTGQVGAALAAGNPVLAKPAEQTPLIAVEAVRLLHAAGIPRDVLLPLPGRGEIVGAALVADPRVQGVVFTGSTDVARGIQRTLAEREGRHGPVVPLIAETGGQNAMIVDSSALTEQVVADALASAFDSAGQRCSALRVLCVQDDVADRVITMLEGAMAELAVGDPRHLAVDVGPVIDEPARAALAAHVERMRARGRRIVQGPCPPSRGTFLPPTMIEIERLDELEQEVFGPVLHVLRHRRDERDRLVESINALGYGLTLGVHSRVDQVIDAIVARARVGNVYVNRNIVGAVVGVQPFGGEGLSGTGPKAGGPLYLHRFLAGTSRRAAAAQVEALDAAAMRQARERRRLAALEALRDWTPEPMAGWRELCDALDDASPVGAVVELPGPTGERNTYSLHARRVVLCIAADDGDRLAQLAAVAAVGARALWPDDAAARALHERLPAPARPMVERVGEWQAARFDAVLHHGSPAEERAMARELAARPGPIVALQCHAPGERSIALERLLVERVVSVNTAAAGGNASLMTVG